MSILKQIKQELSWLDANNAYDLTRGKPSPAQLDISQKILSQIEIPYEMDGIDLRNYGNPEGLPSARKLGSNILSSNFDETIALDNSSLTLMHQVVSCSLFLGFDKSNLNKDSKIICPVPGYDRHFKLLENFGVRMITVPFQDDGPDLNAVKEVLENESDVHGIVCVPRHSNPTGHTYSDKNVHELFKLFRPYNKNFSIMWDNAYACHDLEKTIEQTPADKIAKELGMHENFFQVGSTSKITLAGAGISFLSSSKNNINKFIDFRNAITPGPNKLNQGLHVKYFKLMSIEDQMAELRKIIAPKFDLVKKYIAPLRDEDLCDYTSPTGGYFFSFDSKKNNAAEIIQTCEALGLRLLPVGSCFPYQKDPMNNNIRLAPTFPDLDTLDKCMQIFSKVVKTLN